VSTPRDDSSARRVRGLRANSFATIVISLVEYGLGIWVNLFGNLPASDHGSTIVTGFTRAVADGPVGLSIHALLGVILIISATAALVRSVLVHQPGLIGVTSLGLAAIIVAALSGARFVGDASNTLSMAMAIGAGIAIGAYSLVLFIAGARATPRA
jgi:hypothetical protein